MTSFDCDNARRRREEGWIIGQILSTTKVCTDADGGDHVGQVDERRGRIIREGICAWWHWSIAGSFEHSTEGCGMSGLVLLRIHVSKLSTPTKMKPIEIPYLSNHSNVLAESRRESRSSVLLIRKILIPSSVQRKLKMFEVKSQLSNRLIHHAVDRR